MNLPWINEGKKVLGLHEINDNAALSKWLKSDGRTLGNPAKMPWCGDYVDTALERSIPDEPRPGALGVNPYWALNWGLLGVACGPCVGAVISFKRPGGGHVGFLMGEDDLHYYVLGGNQRNKVSVAPIAKSRMRFIRWPSTYRNPNIALPRMTQKGPVSKNEA